MAKTIITGVLLILGLMLIGCSRASLNELTFSDYYCMGSSCSLIDEYNNGSSRLVTKEECLKIDTISGNNTIQWGQDGEPDCKWEARLERCLPNKCKK